MAIAVVQLKCMQNVTFYLLPILKNFPGLFLSPNPSHAKKSGQNGHKAGFYIPEAPSCRINFLYENKQYSILSHFLTVVFRQFGLFF